MPTGVVWAGSSLSHGCSRLCDVKLQGKPCFRLLAHGTNHRLLTGTPSMTRFRRRIGADGGFIKEVGSSGAASPGSLFFRTKHLSV